jgi:hypothetical protein
MPRKKKTTTEKLEEQEKKTQADEITRIISETCALLDDMLTKANPDLPKAPTAPVLARMQAYLDRRGVKPEDPAWIARMRKTTKNYRLQKAHSRSEDAFDLD